MSLEHWIRLTNYHNGNYYELKKNDGLNNSSVNLNDPDRILNLDGIYGCYKMGYVSGLVNDPIELSTPPYVLGGKKPFSYSFWVFADSNNDLPQPFTSNVNGLMIDFDNDYLTFIQSIKNDNPIYISAFMNGTITKSHLCHICLVYDNVKKSVDVDGNTIEVYKLKMYINGTLLTKYVDVDYIRADQEPADVPSNYNTRFGFHLTGFMQDIRVYSHALSEKEVKELSRGLSYHLKMDTTDNNLYDGSGNKFITSKLYNTGIINSITGSPRYSKCLEFGSGESIIGVDNLLNNMGYTTFRKNPGNKGYIESDARFSISFWFNTKMSKTQTILSVLNTTEPNITLPGFSFIIYNPNGINIIIYDPVSGKAINTLFHIEISINKWYHVCLVYESGIFHLYLNNVHYEEALGTELEFTLPNSVFAIGGTKIYDSGSWVVDTDSLFRGYMSDFRVYRTALNAEDVNEIYQTSASIDNAGNLHTFELNEVTQNDSLYDD